MLENRVKALVATTALEMGFDKPDLAFVFHYQTPGSVVAYYQQVGRAGRALDAAYGVILGGEEETDITDCFIETVFPIRLSLLRHFTGKLRNLAIALPTLNLQRLPILNP